MESGEFFTRRPIGDDTKVLPRHLTAERQALQIEEPRRPLRVGQGSRPQREHVLEAGPARHLPAQHVQKRGVVMLDDPEERRDVL